MMFVPMLGTVIAKGKFKDMGWRIAIKKNIKWILIAWFSPLVLTAVGCVLYFLVFPQHFDLSGEYIVANAGIEALEQLEAQGMTYPLAIALSVISCVTYAPLVNMFFALGEEVGWRGYMYPCLKERHGIVKSWLIGGVIWAAWHWPLIYMIGYEYGYEYIGFPFVGMLVFCACTIALGILCDWLRMQSKSIWLPALFHGSFNAAATIPLTMCKTNTASYRLLGPAPNGLIASLPVFAFALVISLQTLKANRKS